MESAISMLGFWKKQHMEYTLSRKDFQEMCQSEGSNIVDKNCNLKIYFSPFIILFHNEVPHSLFPWTQITKSIYSVYEHFSFLFLSGKLTAVYMFTLYSMKPGEFFSSSCTSVKITLLLLQLSVVNIHFKLLLGYLSALCLMGYY